MKHLTQFPNRHKQGRCDLVVGLDFGTSCTKVVIRSPYEHDRAFAVPFGQAAHRSSPYLLPSALWIGKDGKGSLTRVADGNYLRDMKYYLMQGKPVPASDVCDVKPTFDPKSAVVAFLALALRAIRGWFLTTHRKSYRDFALEWQFNLGLPSADIAKEPLCHDYLRIAAAAWKLSIESTEVQMAQAQAAYDAVRLQDDESTSGVGGFCDCGDGKSAEVRLIPEVAAEVVGYARSHLRDEGLHFLVDIGATTLDICSFILHEKEGDDRYELLTADVRELGAMILHRGRLNAAGRFAPETELRTIWDDDPVSAIPDQLHDFLGALPGLKHYPDAEPALEESDRSYRKQCERALWTTLIEVRNRRDPRSRRWKGELPAFIAGGARGMVFYHDAIGAISDELSKLYPPCTGIQPFILPRPENLEAEIGDDCYHRFAVAWGLSYPHTDIGRVTRPCDTPDIPRRMRPDYDPPSEGTPKEYT